MPKKQPKAAFGSDVRTKSPRIGVTESYHNHRPSWRIAKIELEDRDDPFGWHLVDDVAAEKIRAGLANFESMTWAEILVDGKKGNHSVATSKICKAASDRLFAMRLDDVDQLVSLRLSNKQRVWGILHQGVLDLLWWDPNHEVCPWQGKDN